MERKKIIAVDFDGCLVENKWPEIGRPNWDVITCLRSEIKDGARIILWTCRSGQLLDEAVNWCKDAHIWLDAVNENLDEIIDLFGFGSRKIYADEYWDDKAVLKVYDNFGGTVYES